ncbi:MAG: orotidine-5'-phosphate decarboxylase [Acidimicrobiia bacterium]|nr:orotidine-5'-phosphate decarboxylase [Acidimicrobiia bacterium]
MSHPILVALDFSDSEEALRLASELRPFVGGFKVGLELMWSTGPSLISRVADLGLPVFADAKLHDIPNTVRGAARALASHGARWVTVHGAGGSAMVRAAVEGLDEGGDGAAGALVVTVLTSLDHSDLAETGVWRATEDQVLSMAGLAQQSGAEGVICSPGEVARLKASFPGLLAVTPGIRPEGSSADDQIRISTPRAALTSGADYLVVGRPITRASDPIAAARHMASSL